VDMKTFRVTADFAIDGVPAGQNLVERFRPTSQGVYELRLEKPVTKLGRGKVTVSIADKQGNVSRVERTFSVGD
jgi:hypothetical protein